MDGSYLIWEPKKVSGFYLCTFVHCTNCHPIYLIVHNMYVYKTGPAEYIKVWGPVVIVPPIPLALQNLIVVIH